MSRITFILVLVSQLTALRAQPLAVYVLAGQSNMQGHAKVETFDYIGDDPKTAPLLKKMQNADGKPAGLRRRLDLVSDRRGEAATARDRQADRGLRRAPQSGRGRRQDRSRVHLRHLRWQRRIDGPILIIKTAWGGKSLHTDFRPPSAGPYVFNETSSSSSRSSGKDLAKVKADKVAATGRYYRLMIDHVKKVLARHPKRVYPGYDPEQGLRAGRLRLVPGLERHGRSAAPIRTVTSRVATTHTASAWPHFIRDVRKDLAAPELPFVIGVMGVGGPISPRTAEAHGVHRNFRAGHGGARRAARVPGQRRRGADRAVLGPAPGSHRCQARRGPAAWRAFSETSTKITPTRDGKMSSGGAEGLHRQYRRELLGDDEEIWKRGASNAGYHYLGCAKTMALIGEAFATALLELQKRRR